MKVSILGLGYVGFPLACAAAKKTQHEIIGFDIDSIKIDLIRNGRSPVDDEQAGKDIKEVSIEVDNSPMIMAGSDMFIVCVPTPVIDGFTPDLGPIKSAVLTLTSHLKKGNLVVIESTINPGVCDEIVIPLIEEHTMLRAGVDFDVAHCPERINPGDAKWNVYNIPRNVGSTRPEATKKIADFYREIVDGEINEMPDIKSAEATKIIENTFRDINIAFVNELAKSFDVLGINIDVVIKAAANKPFAFMPHFPGCGVGGHCIPVDPYYLIERAKLSGFDHKFLKLAREINNSMPEYTIELLSDRLNEIEKPVKGTNVGLLGLSYKANVGDLRESPALEIQKLLGEKGANVIAYDPHFPDYSNATDLNDLLQKSDAIIVATNHSEFISLSADDLINNNVKVVIDGKNCLSGKIKDNNEIIYKGIGI